MIKLIIPFIFLLLLISMVFDIFKDLFDDKKKND